MYDLLKVDGKIPNLQASNTHMKILWIFYPAFFQ